MGYKLSPDSRGVVIGGGENYLVVADGAGKAFFRVKGGCIREVEKVLDGCAREGDSGRNLMINLVGENILAGGQAAVLQGELHRRGDELCKSKVSPGEYLTERVRMVPPLDRNSRVLGELVIQTLAYGNCG